MQKGSEDLNACVVEKYFGKKMSILVRRGRIMVGNDPLHEKQAHVESKVGRIFWVEFYQKSLKNLG